MKKNIKKRIDNKLSPNENNLGGRRFLVDQYYNHLRCLERIKPTLNSIQSPKRAPSRSGVPMINQINQFHETFETFRRVASLKEGYIGSLIPPKSLGRLNGKSKNQRKTENDFHNHYLNVKSLKEKIMSQGNLNERQKNPQDVIAHPPIFFRRGKEKAAQLIDNLGFFQVLPNNNNQNQGEENIQVEMQKWLIVDNLLPEIILNENETFDQECEEIFQEYLCQLILENRIYKETDYLNLQDLLIRKCPSLSENYIHQLLQEIYNVFNA